MNLTAELHRRGYGAREIDLLWSGNFRRLMQRVQGMAEI
jgi:microsomal dipeptidase-like Zn-dependent dipeptidase